MKHLFTIKGAEMFLPTADLFLGSLKVEFSEVGTNAKPLEINVYKYFSATAKSVSQTLVA
jgi:hypothetical protein